jgi:hypothetical protein
MKKFIQMSTIEEEEIGNPLRESTMVEDIEVDDNMENLRVE